MDDAQIIEDSLLALAERVFQIQSFVTREVKDMNKYMEGSVESLRERAAVQSHRRTAVCYDLNQQSGVTAQ